MAVIKKICACVPFIDNGHGVPETMRAMSELIEECAAKDARIAELEKACKALLPYVEDHVRRGQVPGQDTSYYGDAQAVALANAALAKTQPPEAGEGRGT